MKKKESNPERYSRLCEPFANGDEAMAAMEAFYNDVGALREKHRIRDVSLVFEVNQILEDGEEGTRQGSMHLGNMANAEAMLAYAYGREKKRREELMMRLAAGKHP